MLWPAPAHPLVSCLPVLLCILPAPAKLPFFHSRKIQLSPSTKLCSVPPFTPYLAISSSIVHSQLQHHSRQSLPCVFLTHSHSGLVPCLPLLSPCFDLIAPVGLLWLLSMDSPKDYQHQLWTT